MKSTIKLLVKGIVRRVGYDIVRIIEQVPPNKSSTHIFDPLADLSRHEKDILTKVKPFTGTSDENIASLVKAVTYLSKNSIPGAMIECGVWRGGSMMAMALTLLSLRDTSRELWLYDTYEGMLSPTDDDVRFDGQPAKVEMEAVVAQSGAWCYASLEEVIANLYSTGYPKIKFHFVKGKVEDTIPALMPKDLSLLRLDTDWYQSTRHELEHLFPRLHPHGVLIVDDYGHWRGSQKAIDEYFGNNPSPVYLHRIDYSARMVVGYGAQNRY